MGGLSGKDGVVAFGSGFKFFDGGGDGKGRRLGGRGGHVCLIL